MRASDPFDRRRNSLTGSWTAQVVQIIVASQVVVMNVSRLRTAVPGLQKWDGPFQHRNFLPADGL
jgi:hypothetical protein